jgi:hypothetical protein
MVFAIDCEAWVPTVPEGRLTIARHFQWRESAPQKEIRAVGTVETPDADLQASLRDTVGPLERLPASELAGYFQRCLRHDTVIA